MVNGHDMTELLQNIEQNTSRYFAIIASAVDEVLTTVGQFHSKAPKGALVGSS